MNNSALHNIDNIQPNPFTKIRGLVFSDRIGMFSCIDEELNVMSLPVYIAGMDDEECIYFFLHEHEPITECIRKNSGANLLFTSSAKRIFLRIDCSVVILLDKSKAKEYWNAYLENFFTKGPEKLKVIKVYVQKATMWEECHSKPKVLYLSPKQEGLVINNLSKKEHIQPAG